MNLKVLNLFLFSTTISLDPVLKRRENHKTKKEEHPDGYSSFFVGVAGFEPATSCSQSRRDDRATLHPVGVIAGAKVVKIRYHPNKFVILFKFYCSSVSISTNGISKEASKSRPILSISSSSSS